MSKNKTANPFKLDIGGRVRNPRNPFDMSYKLVTSMPAGLIVPTYRQDVEPNDYLDYKGNVFVRTEPVQSCAYSRIKYTCDYYGVPYRLVWKWWDMFFTGVDENTDSYSPDFALNKTPAVPTISAASLAKQLVWLFDQQYVDVFGFPAYANAIRLLGSLGYLESVRTAPRETVPTTPLKYIPAEKPMSADFNYIMQFATLYPDFSFNLFGLAAYHCIFYYHFRNVQWDTRNNKDGSGNQSATISTPTVDKVSYNPWEINWNLNRLSGLQTYNTSGAWTPSEAGGTMLTLLSTRYAPYYRDRLTSVVPFLSSDAYANMLGGLDSSWTMRNTDKESGASLDLDISTTGDTVRLSAKNMRFLKAFDNLQRLKGMTPKTYRDQYMSLFGVGGGSCGCTQPFYLGSMHQDVQINPVIATATSSNASDESSMLGQIGGIATLKGNCSFRKEFQEHCVVLGVSHYNIESDYCADIPNPFNLKVKREDFYMPQYDNLGLQPQFAYAAGLDTNLGVDAAGKVKLRDPNLVIGYEPRYSEYKSRLNEIHGEFQYGRSKRNWTTSRSAVMGPTLAFRPGRWAINPSICDTIFPVNYNGDYKTDPFLMEINHNVTLTTNKSTLGVPSF